MHNNMRKLWSSEEDTELICLAEQGVCKADIAKILNRPFTSISSRCKKLGISTKQKFPQNYVEITPSLREIIDGMVISDAGIYSRKSNPSAYIGLEQHPRRLGWLLQLVEELGQHGVTAKIDNTYHTPSIFDGRNLPGGSYIKLRTLNYVEFAQERKRWYPNGKKAIPKDIVITPKMLTHWLCGDGRGGDKKGTLGLCTHGFTLSDVVLLKSKLKSNLDIVTKIQKAHRHTKTERREYLLLVSKQDEAFKLANTIKPFMPECCLYKLSHVRENNAQITKGRGRKLTSKEMSKIASWFQNNQNSKLTYVQMAKVLKIAPSTAWRLKRKFTE